MPDPRWTDFGGGSSTAASDQSAYLDRLQEMERAQAAEYYAGTAQPSRLATGQMRGQALEQTMPGASMGGLRGLQGIRNVGAGGAQAGAQGLKLGEADRLAAINMAMEAESHGAAYEQAAAMAYLQRTADQAALARAQEAATQAINQAEKEKYQRIIGGELSAIGAGVNTAVGYGNTGQQPAPYSSGNAFGQQAYGYGQPQPGQPNNWSYGPQQGTAGWYYDLRGS